MNVCGAVAPLFCIYLCSLFNLICYNSSIEAFRSRKAYQNY